MHFTLLKILLRIRFNRTTVTNPNISTCISSHIKSVNAGNIHCCLPVKRLNPVMANSNVFVNRHFLLSLRANHNTTGFPFMKRRFFDYVPIPNCLFYFPIRKTFLRINLKQNRTCGQIFGFLESKPSKEFRLLPTRELKRQLKLL